MLDKAVDPLGQHALEVALTGSSPRVGRHHTRDRRVGAKEGSELGGGLELGRENGLGKAQELASKEETTMARELAWNMVRSKCSSRLSYWFP